MACVPALKASFPNPIKGINLVPAVPSFAAEIPNACCILPGPISLAAGLTLPPGTVNAAFLQPVFNVLDAIRSEIVSLIPLNCPRS
jgi:hypothetical protein